ncbi:MFS transporter [Actinomadura flavalba]|uniref:MFS transporter n=1 Tax=Actinomadura flavalba TaxID=1120938 RepID=UPI0003A5AEB2|nr:MFS transporter [Actinomadura flavalba]
MEAVSTGGPPVRSGRRETAGLLVLGLPTLLIALDSSIVYLALPRIAVDLRAGSVQQLWIADISVFVMAGLLVTAGALGDRIGRRRLLVGASIALAGASLLAAYAPSPETLIAARALVGAASAALLPSIMGLIRVMFPDARRHARAIAVWMGCFMLGASLGPVAGGAVLDHLWWGSVFLLNVPVVALLVPLALTVLPERREDGARRLHLPSVVLSLATVLPLVYGFKEIAREEAATAPALLALVAGAACGAAFVIVQRRLERPLLDLRLFRNRTLRAAISLTTVAGLLVGVQIFVQLYLQLVEGMTPFRTAVWLLPSTFATVIALQFVPSLTRRFRPGPTIGAGLVVVAAGYALIVLVQDAGQRPLLMAGLVVAGLGIGPLSASAAHLVLRSAPAERAGSAASLNETAGQLGIAAGIAVLGTIGTAVYRGGMDVLPASVPAEAAAAARDGIVGAATTAPTLPPATAADLMARAGEALASSLSAVAVICVVLALAGAAVAALGLRHEPPVGSAPEAGPPAEPVHAPAPAPALEKESPS